MGYKLNTKENPMKEINHQEIWDGMTEDEVRYVLNAQRVEMMVQAKKIETLEAELVYVKAQATSAITRYTKLITKLNKEALS